MLRQCTADEAPWDGRTCPACQGSGKVWAGGLTTPPYPVACPFCEGTGWSGRIRSILMELNLLP